MLSSIGLRRVTHAKRRLHKALQPRKAALLLWQLQPHSPRSERWQLPALQMCTTLR